MIELASKVFLFFISGDKAPVGGARPPELRQVYRVEAGGRPLGVRGTLLRPHQGGLPPLPGPRGHPPSGMGPSLIRGHLVQKPGRQREGLLAHWQTRGPPHLVLPL